MSAVLDAKVCVSGTIARARFDRHVVGGETAGGQGARAGRFGVASLVSIRADRGRRGSCAVDGDIADGKDGESVAVAADLRDITRAGVLAGRFEEGPNGGGGQAISAITLRAKLGAGDCVAGGATCSNAHGDCAVGLIVCHVRQ